ncbi:MAG TPA: hypothetical protein VNZ45_08675 [Bacteroidia bacterium]|jgi:hypothetical protein|nr:hypothetical protein [Bacteroidia bacterium]
METENNPLSHEESLKVITDVIRKTREHFQENSFYFILWGWLIASASFSFFLLHQYTTFRYYFLPFPILVGIGMLVSWRWYVKKKKEHTPETYSGFFFNRLWLVLAISFPIVVFLSVSQHLVPFTYTLVLAGIGTLLSGTVMRFNALKVGGIVLFLSALLCVYIPDAYKPLVSCLAIVAGYLIPGYLLKASHS